MAIHAVLCVVALALLASPALGTPATCPTTLQQWQCDKCATIADATYRAKCWTLAGLGYNLDVIVPCAQQTSDPRFAPFCLDECIAKLPVGQEWRCAKCLPNSVNDKTFCFAQEGRTKIDSDAIVRCASLPWSINAPWRCNDCLFNIAYLQPALGQYNDWRCLKCLDPALVTAGASAARDACFSLVSGVDAINRDNARPTLVTQADDVLTCSKITDATLRNKCYTCLTSRTASAIGTWPCMGCAAKAAGPAATCFDCLAGDLTKSWQCQ